jgi:hypothetical protein
LQLKSPSCEFVTSLTLATSSSTHEDLIEYINPYEEHYNQNIAWIQKAMQKLGIDKVVEDL